MVHYFHRQSCPIARCDINFGWHVPPYLLFPPQVYRYYSHYIVIVIHCHYIVSFPSVISCHVGSDDALAIPLMATATDERSNTHDDCIHW
jgi:hypothetical protein